jgi:hypothetical protein
MYRETIQQLEQVATQVQKPAKDCADQSYRRASPINSQPLKRTFFSGAGCAANKTRS